MFGQPANHQNPSWPYGSQPPAPQVSSVAGASDNQTLLIQAQIKAIQESSQAKISQNNLLHQAQLKAIEEESRAKISLHILLVQAQVKAIEEESKTKIEILHSEHAAAEKREESLHRDKELDLRLTGEAERSELLKTTECERQLSKAESVARIEMMG
ncbi:uncharacterized protein LY89DRAFT_198066 [Mollisia scopiformis]|uniref:Uncharacterized protein n=1 Tax=Mollisia scopiformis TaxID=149040 RepID=A0A194WZG9_MOLSC|nr:uncharacterized protein LY89DRAFT_198066 [Mollisia scopiformis]KUJ12997.1 hypothetical protein LY89DRAFT_198066 [Mollisia scopiformis]